MKLQALYKTKDIHSKGKKGILSAQYGIGGNRVHCYSENGESLYYPSVNAAPPPPPKGWGERLLALDLLESQTL